MKYSEKDKKKLIEAAKRIYQRKKSIFLYPNATGIKKH
jgi:hypothetical protein